MEGETSNNFSLHKFFLVLLVHQRLLQFLMLRERTHKALPSIQKAVINMVPLLLLQLFVRLNLVNLQMSL